MERCVWCNRSNGCPKEVTVEADDRFGLNPGDKTMTAHLEHIPRVRTFYSLVNRAAKCYVLVMVLAGVLALLDLIPLLMVDQ